jgi:hypothetical protein
LSDFIGNHSVFTKGYKNLFVDPTGGKVKEAKHLCETLLEPLLQEYGPLSVSYGYISPELSKKIVSYQDPTAPSYHRWDKGAAADILLHYPLQVQGYSPIEIAHRIDEQYDYSRMITYSESPFICVATQINEGDNPRKAFYENRYCGKKGAKPTYIKKSATPEGRRKQAAALFLEHDWRGAGYPTYHGGGIRQLQHIRVSKYAVASDFLYSTHAVREGIANVPDMRRDSGVFEAAGAAYDDLLKTLDTPRISIVRAFESFRFNDYPLFGWRDNFAIDFIPPSYITLDELADAALTMLGKHFCTVAASKDTGTVRVVGAFDHVS